MRKFITILMIVAMVSLPGRYAVAGGDGGITQVLVSALTKPGGFAIVTVVVQALVFTSLMGPQAKINPANIGSITALQLTAAVTTVYILYALVNYARYYLFYTTYIQPFFLPFPPVGSNDNSSSGGLSAQEQALKDAIWAVSDPDAADVMAAAAEEEVDEEQAAIDAAVDRALKDPELAKKYIQFASPRLRNAVIGALNNQMFQEISKELTPVQAPNAAQAGNFSGVSAARGR